MRKFIPNSLSVSRILISLIILLATSELDRVIYISVITLIGVAMITDWLDGRLARKWSVTSEVGYVLDAMGDRAIHLSLTLVVVVRYGIPPVFAWLLIFRDIAIYAIRVLTPDWHSRSKELRWISLTHATSVRIWLGTFFLRDGLVLFSNRDPLGTLQFSVVQYILLISTLILSYWGLWRALSWIQDIRSCKAL